MGLKASSKPTYIKIHIPHRSPNRILNKDFNLETTSSKKKDKNGAGKKPKGGKKPKNKGKPTVSKTKPGSSRKGKGRKPKADKHPDSAEPKAPVPSAKKQRKGA